jgi:TP901 family phage tail tape measure protein
MADNLITTNITANADFTGLRTQLAATTAQLLKLQETTAGTNAKLASQIAVMNKAFATTLTSTGQFSQHFVSLTSDVEKFGKNLDRGRLKLNDYYNTWNGHTKRTSNLVRDLAKQQVMLQQAIIQPVGKNAQGLMQYNVMVAKGLDEVKNKTAIAKQELAIMNKVMNDGAGQLINWGKNTQWAGRQLTVGLTVPLAAFGMAAQKAFREADAELVRLTKVYGGLSAVSATELAKVRKDVSDTAREIAGSYGIAYKDTIALAADLAATGQQGQQLLEATKETSRLAVLGEVDRQEAMKATLAIQNAFKSSTDELTQSIDFLNAVENQTSTSLADLVEAIPKAGPVVKSLGGDVKDLALYLTAMKEGGVNASEGANAIKSAMASLINPTKVAKEMFTGFGINIDQIVTSNAGNLTATITELQAALDNLDPLSKSRAIEQLFGKFQYARMSALFENLGKEGSQTLQVMDLMKASATDLANISSRELGMMTESASGKFKRALASVQADLASVGNQFLTISTKVLEVVDGIIKFFQKLPQPVKTFLNVLGGITAVSGPIIMLAGVMGNFIGYVIKGIFHLRQLAKGGQGFKLLTPEIMAADAAAKGLATSFYSDTEATVVLTNAVNTLAASFDTLELKANAAKVAVQPGISTIAGGVIAAGGQGQRVVDKNNPLIGAPYSRDMSHMIPAQTGQPGTIFGTVPGASPVNVRIGKNPQAYMNQDLPRIPGVTSVNGISTGVVAGEAAKWHAMTAAIAMQSEAELKMLKQEVMATGTITSSLADSYQALLPQFSEITELAAQETALIVKQLQASKITADQARAKVIQLNATIEAMLAETAAATATTMGRGINLTTVPLTSQPVIDPATGKSNMKEMFHKGTTKDLVDRIARALGGVRTSGAGYNIQTTKPKFAKGGIVPGTGDTDTYHTTAEPGAFVINKKSTERNMPTISKLLGGTPTFRNAGGAVPVVLTPGEAVIPANIAQRDPGLMLQLNGGPGNTSGMGRFDGGKIRAQAEQNIRGASAYVSRLSIPKNFLEDTQVRHVMHDAAILNKLGMSEVESIRTAKRLYDEARQYAYDPKTDTINDERMLEIKEKQTRELDKKIGGGLLKKPLRSGSGKMMPTPTGNRNSAVHPSPSLLATLTKMGFANAGEVKRLQMELFGRSAWDPESQKWIPNTHGYTTEHDQRAAKYGYSATGNFGQAQAGNKDINSWTNTFSKLTEGSNNPFEDRLPQTETEKRMAIDTIGKVLGLGTGPGTEERIIKAPLRVKHNFGITKVFMDFLKAKKGRRLNAGGMVPGQFAQKLFGGGGVKGLFLGMPRSIKQVEAQRAAKAAMEKANQAVKDSRFSKTPVTDYDGLLEPTSGRSFPVAGIGGIYSKGGDKVFVKPVLDEKAALAELRATEIARDVHGLQTPNQRIVVMRDPTDPKGARTLLALESKYNPSIANQDGKFTSDQYFRQLVASALRGDKDLGRGNLSGNILADVGPAGVFATASGQRDYSATMPSFKHQAMVNLLGVKGSSTRNSLLKQLQIFQRE